MSNSVKTLSQNLRAVSRRDWSVFFTFALTLAGLWIVADEVYWHSDVHCACLTAADGGRLIGATAASDFSKYRNRFYLFDDDLQVKQSFRLRTEYSWGQHALSEDGKSLVYVVREPVKWPATTDLVLELKSLDGSQKSAEIVLSVSEVQKMLGHERGLNGVSGLQLIDSPPNRLLLKTGTEIFLIDGSGKIISYLDYIFHNSILSRNYAVATAQMDRKWYLNGYAVDSDRLTQIYYEFPQINPSVSAPGPMALNARGIFAIQDKDQIRVVDLRKEVSLQPDVSVPWRMADGKLIAISGDAHTLLLGNEQRVLAVSSQDGKVMSEISGPFYIFSPKFLDDHRIVFTKSSREDSESGLVIWDWNDSSTKEVSFGNHSVLTKQLIHLSFCVIVLLWTGCFYAYSIRRKRLWFGITVLIVTALVFIRYLHLAPSADRLIMNYRDLQIMLAPVLCQVGLSVAAVWSYRYWRFSLATALILCLASYTARWYHMLGTESPYQVFDAKIYFQNMVLVFAVEVILVQSYFAWRASKKLNSATIDLFILTVAAAIVTKLLMDVVLDQQDRNTVIFGAIGGTIHLLQTFYADGKARVPLRLVALIWLPLTASGFFSSILLLGYVLFSFGIGMVGTIQFWLSLGVSDLIVFVLTWAMLRLVYRCFAQSQTAVDNLRFSSEAM